VAADLDGLENPADVSRLVVFDTWVRNCDRHPSDLARRKPNYANVYLADTDDPNRSELVAIDHSHCFNWGHDFSARLSDIDVVRDAGTYGLFPAFVALVDPGELAWCRGVLRTVTADVVEPIVAALPAEWAVSTAAAAALGRLVVERAAFVCSRIDSGWPLRGPSPGGTPISRSPH
jgi:hypothetical protein